MSAERRLWDQHQPGDRYILITCTINTDVNGDWVFDYVAFTPHQGSLEQAWRKGLRELDRSDDFNIGVLRDKELIALLWHNEIVDDAPDVIADIAKACGL